MLTAEQMVKYRKSRAEGFGPEQARIQATTTLGQQGPFDKWECYPGAEVRIERDGFNVTIRIEQDESQDISDLGETFETGRYQDDEHATRQNESRWREGAKPYYRFEREQIWDSKKGALTWTEPREVLYFRSSAYQDSPRLVRPVDNFKENWEFYRVKSKMGRHAAYNRARENFLFDCKRISDWSENNWTMTYVTVRVSFEGEELGFASLSGIESDSGYETYNEVAEELMEEALDEAKKEAPEIAAAWRERAERLVAAVA
jgi:hypothetical protein